MTIAALLDKHWDAVVYMFCGFLLTCVIVASILKKDSE